MDAQDPSQLRISDDDRHKVAEVLREAAGEGRIDMDELCLLYTSPSPRDS